MAHKRRKDEEDGDDEAPASKASRDSPEVSRKAKFRAHLTALNQQFADWVSGQASRHTAELWLFGAKDYVAHAEKLLTDFKDVLDAERSGGSTSGFGGGSSSGWGSGAALGGGSSGAGGSGAGGSGLGGLFGGSGASGSGMGGGSNGAGGALLGGAFGGGVRDAFRNSNGPFGASGDKPTGAPNGDATTDLNGHQQPDSNRATTLRAAAPDSFTAPAPASNTSADAGTGPTSFGFFSSTPATSTGGLSGAATGSTSGTGAAGGGLFKFGGGASGDAAAAPAVPATTAAAPAATASGFWNQPFTFGGAPASTTPSGDAAAGGSKATEAVTAPASGAATTSASAPASAPAAASKEKETAAAPGGFFSFGAAAPMPVPSFGPTAGGFTGFSFGGGSALPASTLPAFAAEEEGEEEQPQKYESAVETNEEAGVVHFKAKSKFFRMKSGSWDLLGVGQLMVRTRHQDPTKPFITFTTEAGRVLYCANVHKSMKLIVNEAKHTVAWSATWAPEGTEGPPSLQSVMAQLPKGKYPEFVQPVEKLQQAMA